MDNKTCKGGVYKHLNTYPEVVKNPTRYTGTMNATVSVNKTPTKYTGGKNPNLVTVKKSF
jgi:hypothetical protein